MCSMFEAPPAGRGETPARKSISVLLVEGNAEDAELIDGRLYRCTQPRFLVTVAPTVALALPIARKYDHDAILLDLALPDSTGLAGVRELALAVPRTPIVILTRMEGQEVAVQAIRLGAQDYLVKSTSDTGILTRSIQMAIERKSFEAQLIRRANFDQLTGLVNRTLFHDRLTHALARAKRWHERTALLFIDLDGFKTVNDTLGHAVGDRVLRLVADRFRAAVRESETIARYGGDEFMILIESLVDAAAARKAAERALSALQAPLTVAKEKIRVTASIGVAIFPEDAGDADTLLHNADAAMFHAKNSGRNNLQFFRQG